MKAFLVSMTCPVDAVVGMELGEGSAEGTSPTSMYFEPVFFHVFLGRPPRTPTERSPLNCSTWLSHRVVDPPQLSDHYLPPYLLLAQPST